MRRRIGRRLDLIVLAVALSTCDATPPAAAREATLTGTWGGPHVRLELAPTMGAAEYDCAHGSLTSPRPDADGRFVADGWHVREHGGPIREGETVDSVPARYSGTVVGDRMTLRVVAGADTLGPFALRRAGAAQLSKCL